MRTVDVVGQGVAALVIRSIAGLLEGAGASNSHDGEGEGLDGNHFE